jgi:hypothetical protein
VGSKKSTAPLSERPSRCCGTHHLPTLSLVCNHPDIETVIIARLSTAALAMIIALSGCLSVSHTAATHRRRHNHKPGHQRLHLLGGRIRRRAKRRMRSAGMPGADAGVPHREQHVGAPGRPPVRATLFALSAHLTFGEGLVHCTVGKLRFNLVWV